MIAKTVLVILIVILSGCTINKEIIRFEPTHDWEIQDSIKVSYQTIDSVEVCVNFEETNKYNSIFFLYLKNLSNDIIEITPSVIKVSAANDMSNLISDSYILKAYNPASEIIKIEKEINTAKEFYYSNSAINIIYLLNSISSLLNQNEKHITHNILEGVTSFAISQNDLDKTAKPTIADLEKEGIFWQNIAFNKTILFPGEEAGGITLFDPVDMFRYVQIQIPIKQNTAKFIFQKEIRYKKKP